MIIFQSRFEDIIRVAVAPLRSEFLVLALRLRGSDPQLRGRHWRNVGTEQLDGRGWEGGIVLAGRMGQASAGGHGWCLGGQGDHGQKWLVMVGLLWLIMVLAMVDCVWLWLVKVMVVECYWWFWLGYGLIMVTYDYGGLSWYCLCLRHLGFSHGWLLLWSWLCYG